MKLPPILYYLGDLIYPNLCLACEEPLSTGEKTICLKCQLTLPKTHYHNQRGNPVEKQLWGKIHFEAATAFYHFIKGSRVQHLIHQIKYKGHREAAIKIGKLFGEELLESEIFADIQIITSIPLHKEKLKKRSYNQSDLICEGISIAMQKPFIPDLIQRTKFTETQTRKRRMERVKNVQNIFAIPEPALVENKHVLIVDDVITTGSTLESCANELLQIPKVKISIAALATAQH